MCIFQINLFSIIPPPSQILAPLTAPNSYESYSSNVAQLSSSIQVRYYIYNIHEHRCGVRLHTLLATWLGNPTTLVILNLLIKLMTLKTLLRSNSNHLQNIHDISKMAVRVAQCSYDS